MQLNTAKRASFDEGSLDQYLREISQYPLITREEEVTLAQRSEEHTSELQSQSNLVCRLLLEMISPRSTDSPLSTRRPLHTPARTPRPRTHSATASPSISMPSMATDCLNTNRPLTRTTVCSVA